MSMNLRLEVEENQIADLTLKMRIGTHRVRSAIVMHFANTNVIKLVGRSNCSV